MRSLALPESPPPLTLAPWGSDPGRALPTRARVHLACLRGIVHADRKGLSFYAAKDMTLNDR